MQHSVDYLLEALLIWLDAGDKINYSVQDHDILTAIGLRLDVTPRDDNREKSISIQNLNYTRRRTELARPETMHALALSGLAWRRGHYAPGVVIHSIVIEFLMRYASNN